MKRSLIAMLIACSLFTFCSCGKKFDTESGSESGVDSQGFDSEETGGGDSSKTQPDTPDTEYANAEKVFTKDFDGFIMTIVTDKSEYRVGEPIRVTASLENTRDESIYLYYDEAPKSPKTDCHLIELKTRVHIEDWYADPLDLYWDDTETFSIPVQSGRRYVQSLLFQPCRELVTEDSSSRPDLDNPAEPGVYDGNFNLLIDPDPRGDNPLESYDLDFSVTIKDLDSADSNNRDFNKAQPDTPDTEYANAGNVFTKDFDGFLMTIVTDKSEYRVGEPIRVTASLENTRDEMIYLEFPELIHDPKTMHPMIELTTRVKIRNWYIAGLPYCAGDAVTEIPFQSCERHMQTIQILPCKQLPTYDDSAILFDNPAEPGVYDGNFSLTIKTDPENLYDPTRERCDLDFTVTIK